MKIAINGLGRIGRNILRAAINKGVHVAALNDVMDIELAAYLLRHDTTRGGLNVKITDKDLLNINGYNVRYTNYSKPENTRFEDCDVVLECTGRFLSSSEVSGHIKGNVKKVIISAPACDDTPTYVLGVNHDKYRGEKIISNASCTTNCLAPIAKVLDENFGIVKGFMTTIHSYTMDQKLLDSPNYRDIRRSRAAAENIIPTFTGAARAVYKVLPSLKGRLDGRSVRVPVANVSLMDLVLELKTEVKAADINTLLEYHSKNDLKGIIEIDKEYKVSSDINSNPASAVLAADLTQTNSTLVKIFAWYDNEWGYSNRMVEMAQYILQKS